MSLHDRVFQFLIDHGVAAVFDDDRLPVIFLNKRQRFNQYFGPQLCIQLCIHLVSFLFVY